MKRFLLFLFLFCPMIAIGQNKTDSVSTDGGFSRFKLLANGVFSVRSIWAKTTGNTNRDVYTSVKIIFGEEKNTYQYCLDVNQTKEDKLVTLTTVKLGIEYDELVKINDAIASLRQDFNTDLADHTLARPTARNQRENYNVDIMEESTQSIENEYTSSCGFTIGYIIKSSDYTWFYHYKKQGNDRAYYYYDSNSYVKEIEPLANDFQKAQKRIEQLKIKYGK